MRHCIAIGVKLLTKEQIKEEVLDIIRQYMNCTLGQIAYNVHKRSYTDEKYALPTETGKEILASLAELIAEGQVYAPSVWTDDYKFRFTAVPRPAGVDGLYVINRTVSKS